MVELRLKTVLRFILHIVGFYKGGQGRNFPRGFTERRLCVNVFLFPHFSALDSRDTVSEIIPGDLRLRSSLPDCWLCGAISEVKRFGSWMLEME
jgi:hypothetical protein